MRRYKNITRGKTDLIHPLAYERSIKNVTQFLETANITMQMKAKAKTAWFLLKYMEQQCSNGINSNRAKLMYCNKAYRDEIKSYRQECMKSKDKEKRALIKPLTLVERRVPKELFR